MKQSAPYLYCLLALTSVAATALAGCATPGGAAAGPAAAAPTSAQAGDATIVAIAPPAHPQYSIWDFLGVPQMMAIHQPDLQNKSNLFHSVFSDLLSAFPPLEPPPAPLPLTDPANSGEDAPPANQAASSVKKQEDAANQKIKALKYLATIGCQKGYPEIEEAFLSALDDPTEKVRYTAVRALRDVAGSPCEACKSGGSCCTPAIIKKLHSLGYDTDEKGCPIEPSADVRREARLALNRCGGYVPEAPDEEPIEGPLPAPDMLEAESVGPNSSEPDNVRQIPAEPAPAPVPEPELNPITIDTDPVKLLERDPSVRK
jgi:hypothetical protein